MRPSALHVLTRGSSPDHDYRWLDVQHLPPVLERPPLLDPRSAALIQSEVPSVLVARVQGYLLVWITALESSRSDVQARRIRNAVCITVEDEPWARGLAIAALEPEDRQALAAAVDAEITDDGRGGVRVGRGLEAPLARFGAAPAEPASDDRKLLPLDAEHLEDLADELRDVAFPPREGVLLLVTGALASDRLTASGAWRGASRLVSAPLHPASTRPRRNSSSRGKATREGMGRRFGRFIEERLSPGVSEAMVKRWLSALRDGAAAEEALDIARRLGRQGPSAQETAAHLMARIVGSEKELRRVLSEVEAWVRGHDLDGLAHFLGALRARSSLPHPAEEEDVE